VVQKIRKGRGETEDDPCPGGPWTSKRDANIEKVSESVRKNRCLSIRAVAELANIDKESVQQILHEHFNTKKVCLKMVPRILTPEQKETRMNILQNIENDPDFVRNVITCDESWLFQYDPETKRQSMHWKSKSNFKAMIIVFFDIRGIVHIDWVPEGHTINQVYYREFLTILLERVRRKRPEMWKKGS
jgi:hypothetical protein